MYNINEKCAVVAVTNKNAFDVSRLVYLGLWSLQHRGQDSSGIASYDGNALHVHKKGGLVSQVYDEESLAKVSGQLAIGHNRYSTSGGKDEQFNQPYVDRPLKFAFAHNGNLPYVNKLEKYLREQAIDTQDTNDSGMMARALANEIKKTGSLKKALNNCWNLFTGAFSCVGILGDQLFAFRDQHGIRPLALGRTDNGYVVASETAALDIIGADFIRDVKPGELIVISNNELQSEQIRNGKETIDAFEFVYLARPDSRISGQSIYSARFRAGKLLARTKPVQADVVIAVPDSGVSAASGYAHEAGIPMEFGLLKNRYIGRTFIEPEKIRKSSVELKFNVVVEIVAGKDIVLIDDSLVRGNTLKHVVKVLREYGAKKIHVRIASPPVKYPDYYGIDTPKENDLLSSMFNESEIAQRLGVDSLVHISLNDWVKSTGLQSSQLCLSCFNGQYPIAVPYRS